MTMRATLSILAVLAALAAGRGEDKKTAAFDKFKQLEGEWVGKETGGAHDVHGDVHVKYKLTGGGTALMETLFPGTDHEMVTVIHADGPDLLLTHYCMLGNQPRMKASAPEGNTVAFKFAGATNLKSDQDMHMHDATYTFVDKDTLKTEWLNFDKGKEAGKVVFELKRKK
ncbi:MAG: hypothetical protein ACJ8F7_07815 [Gemmataceae bacterium]